MPHVYPHVPYQLEFSPILPYCVLSRYDSKQSHLIRPKYSNPYAVLYTYIYFIRFIMPHMPCIPIFYSKSITILAHAPTQYPNKRIYSFFFYRDYYYTYSIVHNLHQKRTHPLPSEMTQENYLFFPIRIICLLKPCQENIVLITIWSIPYQMHLWLQPPHFLFRLYFDVHITKTRTPSHQLQNPARSLSPIVRRTHPYYKKPPSDHYTQYT